MNDALRLKIASCKELPTLPAIATKIILLADEPTATIADIAQVINADPVLAATLMRFVNTPVYHRVKTFTTLPQAITYLGFNTTLMVALSFSLCLDWRKLKSLGLDLKLYWRRCLLSAAVGRVLTRCTKEHVNTDEVFLACLLQDIGILALDAALPELYYQAELIQESHEGLIAYEKNNTEDDHATVGAWLLEQWHLPQSLINCVASSHHGTEIPKHDSRMAQARCVALSGLIADSYLMTNPEEALVTAMELAKHYWNVEATWIDTVFEEMATEVPIIERLFEMDIIDPTLTQTLLEMATELTEELD